MKKLTILNTIVSLLALTIAIVALDPCYVAPTEAVPQETPGT